MVILSTLTLFSLIIESSMSASAQQSFISISAGRYGGVYYPTARAICRLVNRLYTVQGIQCVALRSKGAVDNINFIRNNPGVFGIAQSDTLHHALKGTSNFGSDGKFSELRTVFWLHDEAITFVVKKNGDIRQLNHMKRKRFNKGESGSATRQTWKVLARALGWSTEDESFATEMTVNKSREAFCDDQISGFLSIKGHPSVSTEHMILDCDGVLIPVTGKEIDWVLSNCPYFRKVTIPKYAYNAKSDVETFGVWSAFVTTKDVDEETVYLIVKTIFEGLNHFNNMHPALSRLTPENMVPEVSIENEEKFPQIHRGAAKYYKEKRFIK